MEKMMRVNLLVPPRLWPALAKAAAESGHPRASFVRMVLQQACEKGAAPVRAASAAVSIRTDPPVPTLRTCAPFTLSIEELKDIASGKEKDPNRMYAARIYRGDSDAEALEFMRTHHDPFAIDPYVPVVTQPEWGVARELALAELSKEDSFELNPDERYWRERDNGLTHEQAISSVRFAIEANSYTKAWIPPPDDESEGKPS